MKNSKIALTFIELLMLCQIFASFLFAAELNIGQKVVYPGGADQPPKEKDVGVKLKVNPISASVETREAEATEEDYEELLKAGKAREVLKLLGDKNDPVSEGYRILALNDLGMKNEARAKAEKLLKSDDLPEYLRNHIEELDLIEKPKDSKRE